MTTPFMLFAADTHLSKLVWSNRPTIKNDSYRAFNELIDIAIEKRVPLVLGGDVFDKRLPSAESVSVAYAGIERMAQVSLPVLFVQGQHCLSSPTWLSIHPWARHLSERDTTIFGFNVYGLDWQPHGQLQEQLAKVTGRFLVSHQVWKEHMGDIGSPEGSFTEIPNVEYVLTGDYHKTLIKEHIGASGQRLVSISPGSTHMRAIDEPPQKHCVLFSSNTNKEISFELIPLHSRPFIGTEINTTEQLDDFCQQWRQTPTVDEDLRPLLRVTYPNDLPEATSRIRSAVANKVHLFENLEDVTEYMTLTAVSTPEQAESVTVVTAIEQLADSPELNSAAGHLWASTDPLAMLGSMYQNFERVVSAA